MVLKRAVFIIGLAAIPLTFGLLLIYVYKRTAVSTDYRAEVAKQDKEFKKKLNEVIGAAGEKNKDNKQELNGVSKPAADNQQDYTENWARALNWVPMPGVTGNFLPNVRGKFVNTNDLGYRGTVNFREQISQAILEKAQGKYIAVFVGGSSGFGLYSDDDNTDIVGYMNKKSKQTNGKLVFYNFAMGSYTSAEELAAVVTYAHMLNPDLLIVFDGYNDALRLTHTGVYHMGIGVPYTSLGIREVWPHKFKSEWLDRVYDASRITTDEEVEFFAYYTKNIRLMSRVMSSFSGTTILASQPFFAFKNLCYNSIAYRITEDQFTINLKQFYPKFVAAQRTVAAEEKALYLDLSSVFENERCLGAYVDSVHMSSAGQKIIGEQLYDAATIAIRSLESPAGGP